NGKEIAENERERKRTEVISLGAISAPMFSLKGPAMVQSRYPTAFPLKHQQKDMRLALGLAVSLSHCRQIRIKLKQSKIANQFLYFLL
nr:glyoxylate/succinic semialdehyde reductase 2, chloroplastic [Tanacetum cinerariifolium]